MDILQWITTLCFIAHALARIDMNITSKSSEAQLVSDLLKRYTALGQGPGVRPRRNSSDLVEVQLGMRLITLDVDEKLQTLTASVWLRMKWFDDFLMWNPADYGGMTNVVLPYGSVWMPENIALVNTAGAEFYEYKVDLQVKYTGQVFYAPHRVFHSGCLLDITNYPFDSHTCHLWLQSASRYSFQMDLIPYSKEPMDLSTYMDSFRDSVEWEVTDNLTERYDRPRDEGAILMYSRRVSIKFSLSLKRRLGFTAIILMIPCIFLSLLTCVIFCLPPENSDRQSLAMGLFGSLFVTLLILLESAPPSAASVPLLGIYYCFSLLIIIAAIFASAVTTNIRHRGEASNMPAWMHKVILGCLAPLLCVDDRPRPRNNSSRNNNSRGHSTHNLSNAEDDHHNDPDSPAKHNCVIMQTENGDSHGSRKASCDLSQGGTVREETVHVECSWYRLSRIIDRFCTVLFFIANIVAVCLLFPRPA